MNESLNFWQYLYRFIMIFHIFITTGTFALFAYICFRAKGTAHHKKWGRFYIKGIYLCIASGLLMTVLALWKHEIHPDLPRLRVLIIQFNSFSFLFSSFCIHQNLIFNIKANPQHPGWRKNLFLNSLNLLFNFSHIFFYFSMGEHLIWLVMIPPNLYPFLRQIQLWFWLQKKVPAIRGHIQAVFTAGASHVFVVLIGGTARHFQFFKGQDVNPLSWVGPIALAYIFEQFFWHKYKKNLHSS